MATALQTLTSSLQAHLLMARPYSIAEHAFIALAAKALATGAITPLGLKDAACASATLLLWFGFCWHLESVHKHENRPQISTETAAAGLVGGVALSAAISLSATLPAFLYSICALIYSQKEGTSFSLGAFSFVVRGASHALLFATASLFYAQFLSSNQLLAACAIGLAMAGRNLAGDLRDVQFDKKTFPVVFGASLARITVFALFLSAAILLSSSCGGLCGLPLLTVGVAALVTSNGYKLHQTSVIVTMAAIAILASAGEAAALATLFLAASAFSTLLFYGAVPRASNPVENSAQYFH